MGPIDHSALEAEVVRTALECRRKRLSLRNAPFRAQNREGMDSLAAFDAAVEALAKAREAESPVAQLMGVR